MGELSVKTTMRAIADGLEDADVVDKAWPYPVEGADVGHAVVGYPTFKLGSGAFRRVMDTATFPVLIIAGVAEEESTQDTVDALISGASDVKDAIEAGLADVVEFSNVSGGSVERVTFGGVRYAAVRFDVEVTA
jgi:hypothetical protein